MEREEQEQQPAPLRRRAVKLASRGLLAASIAAGGVTAAAVSAGAVTKSKTSSHITATTKKSTSTSTNSGTMPAGPGGPGGPGGHGGPPGIELTVTSINSTTLVGSTPDGTSETWTLSDSTTYNDNGTATESDISVGDEVAIMPVKSSDSSGSDTPPTGGTAASVTVIHPFLAGEVVSVSGSGSDQTIVVSDESGFYRTIVTSASTTYTDDGASVTSPTITAGEFIMAVGDIASNHTTLDATSIAIGKPQPPTTSGTSNSSAGSSHSSGASGSSATSANTAGAGTSGFGPPRGGPGGFAPPAA